MINPMKKFIVLFLSIFFMISIVFANSMASTSLPGKTGLFVNKDSGIAMIDEKIIINIHEDLEKTSYLVSYTFMNVKGAPIEEKLTFMTSDYFNMDAFKVSIDGVLQSSETSRIERKEIKNWTVEENFDYIDPFNENILETGRDKYHNNHLNINTFELDIKPKEKKAVFIEYETHNGYISPRVTDYLFDVKLTSYMLSPASFYDGKGSVNIEINTPENILIRSNIKLNQRNEEIYEIKDYKLKADENLHLSFTKKPGLKELYAYNKSGFINNLMLIQGGLLLIIFIIKRKSLRKILFGFFLLSLVGYLRVADYGTLFFLNFLIRLLWLPILFIIVFYFSNKKKKREE